ncbi:MAG TPA: hypothetical protein VIJ04_05785 [Xanthobacteraceae bacterium]
MPQELEKVGSKLTEAEIAAPIDTIPAVSTDILSRHFNAQSVSISLKYYMKSCECFSEWQNRDLKKFSSIIEKIGGYTPELLQGTYNLCVAHKGPPAAPRFRRPDNISEDILFHELKVDSSNKARIHGFFAGSVFFLVWLDRSHACFPS